MSPAEIASDAIYPRDTFLERTGLSDDDFESLIRAGLPTTRIDEVTFILGEHFIEFCRRRATVVRALEK